MTLTSETGADVYYTTDGSAAIAAGPPSDSALLYVRPIPITQRTELHWVAFDRAGNSADGQGTYDAAGGRTARGAGHPGGDARSRAGRPALARSRVAGHPGHRLPGHRDRRRRRGAADPAAGHPDHQPGRDRAGARHDVRLQRRRPLRRRGQPAHRQGHGHDPGRRRPRHDQQGDVQGRQRLPGHRDQQRGERHDQRLRRRPRDARRLAGARRHDRRAADPGRRPGDRLDVRRPQPHHPRDQAGLGLGDGRAPAASPARSRSPRGPPPWGSTVPEGTRGTTGTPDPVVPRAVPAGGRTRTAQGFPEGHPPPCRPTHPGDTVLPPDDRSAVVHLFGAFRVVLPGRTGDRAGAGRAQTSAGASRASCSSCCSWPAAGSSRSRCSRRRCGRTAALERPRDDAAALRQRPAAPAARGAGLAARRRRARAGGLPRRPARLRLDVDAFDEVADRVAGRPAARWRRRTSRRAIDARSPWSTATCSPTRRARPADGAAPRYRARHGQLALAASGAALAARDAPRPSRSAGWSSPATRPRRRTASCS